MFFVVIGGLWLLGSIIDYWAMILALIIFIILQIKYWIFQINISPKWLQYTCNTIAVVSVIAFYPAYKWIEDKIKNWEYYDYLTYWEDFGEEKFIYDNDEYSRYLCDCDLIKELGGVVDTTYSGIIYGPYSADMSRKRFYKKKRHFSEEELQNDRNLDRKALNFLSDGKLYGLIAVLRGDTINDERISVNLDSICKVYGDSLTLLYGKPYFTYNGKETEDDERVMAWTGGGLVHALIAQDQYVYNTSYPHYASVYIMDYNPKYYNREIKRKNINLEFDSARDSIVSLSFKGIRLGGSFNDQVLEAVKKNEFTRGHWTNDKSCYFCYTRFTTREREGEAYVVFYVFDDQIYKIEVKGPIGTGDLYHEKYGLNHYFKNQHIDISYYNDITYVDDSLQHAFDRHCVLSKRTAEREEIEERERRERERKAELERKVSEQEY